MKLASSRTVWCETPSQLSQQRHKRQRSLLITRFIVSLKQFEGNSPCPSLPPCIKPALSSRRLPRLSRFSAPTTPCLFWPNRSRDGDGAITSAFLRVYNTVYSFKKAFTLVCHSLSILRFFLLETVDAETLKGKIQ